MTCTQCHTQNKTGRQYCASCGQRLAHACTQCAFLNDPGDRFCGGCGTPLAWSPPLDINTTVSASPTNSLAFAPAHRRDERIYNEQSGLSVQNLTSDERKTVTALFADLKGSTAMIEGLDPEEARALIDPALQLMMEAIHRYEGYVAQALGDGIFALFGAPIAHEDHPQRAIYAALRMQDDMRRYSNEVRLTHGVSLAMRIGVNTGEVLMRSISKDDLRTDYVPVGHATNLAARMEQMATPGSIFITDHTKKLIEHYFEVNLLGAAQIKGVEAPLNVYEVVGVGPLRTRLHVASQRGLSRFIGRRGELDQLQAALARAKAGQGQMVGVTGEPGLGKSRLFYEFKRLCHGCVLLETSAVSYGSRAPYLPVIALLKSYFYLQPHDDDRTRRERVLGKVLALDRHLEETLPYLCALLGIEEHASSLEQLDPQMRRQRTYDAVTRLLLRESYNQCLVLLVEDLQWIDRETREFLDTFSDTISEANVVLLVNYRPEYRHAWGQKRYYTDIQLAPLGTGETEEFLTNLLGVDSGLTTLKHQVLTKTEGTPFFMEEVVQTLVDEHVLQGERGNYCLSQEITDLRIPPTVQGLLAARIDRLTPAEKLLLQRLSVIGRTVPFTLLRRVIAGPEEELYRLLSSLQQKAFLYAQSAFPNIIYRFKHALTQDVAYNSVLIERRKALHLQTAQAIEQIFHDQIEDYYNVLAYHYSNSGHTEQAMNYLLRDLRVAWLTSLDQSFPAE
ncbi:MAG: adenylate/guanylate cyclase domain-containing protein [Candidatus Binatia bacterium]